MMSSAPPEPEDHQHRILIVDDDPIVIVAEEELLVAEGHEVRSADNIEDAIALVRDFEPDLVLLDYILPGGSGADVVRAIREFNRLTQVILVSSVTGQDPVRKLLSELDIQGFHYKKDGEFRLLLHVDAALKHSRVLRSLARQKNYLRRILDASPNLSRVQPLPELFDTALRYTIQLVTGDETGTAGGDGVLVLLGPDGFKAHAWSGEFAEIRSHSDIPDAMLLALQDATVGREIVARDGLVLLPFCTQQGQRGCMVVAAERLPRDSREPCQLYATHLEKVLENLTLYQRATTDPLTQVHNRDFGQRRLSELLIHGTRNQQSTGVILLDVDHFKVLNDTHGHAAGDAALKEIAKAIRGVCRSMDIVSRFGGEEFVVILPGAEERPAMNVAHRILDRIRQHPIGFRGRELRVTASAGVAIAEPGELDGDEVVRRADVALYASKHSGRDRVTGPADTDVGPASTRHTMPYIA